MSRRKGSTRCVPCQKNREPKDFGLLSGCQYIEGTVITTNGRCKFCKPGEKTFTPDNEIGCESCGADTTKYPSLTRCIKCPKGQVIMNNNGECGQCFPGQEYYPGVNQYRGCECLHCNEDFYKPTSGQHRCKKCPLGSRSNGTTCITCSPGTRYSSYEKRCITCPPGQRYFSDTNFVNIAIQELINRRQGFQQNA